MKYLIFGFVCCSATCLNARAESESLIDFSTKESLIDWSFGFGVSLMTKNEIDDFLSGEMSIEEGDAGAEIYQFTATKKLATLSLDIGGKTYHPLVEMPLCLELVDEHANNPFLVYNASLQLRWVDFPSNSWFKPSFAVGLGLSYASEIYAMDKQRHPGENRSNLKFNLPIEIAFDLPGQNNERLSFYLTHHSGGFGIFDVGGFNSVGIAFSRTF